MQIFKNNKLANELLDFITKNYQLSSFELLDNTRNFDTQSFKFKITIIESKNKNKLVNSNIEVMKEEFIESVEFVVDYHLNIKSIYCNNHSNLLYKQCCVINDIKDYCKNFGVKHN